MPTTLMQLMSGWREWTTRLEQVGDLGSQQAKLLSGDMESIAEGARILLSTTSKATQVRLRGPGCSERLLDIAQGAPAMLFIAVIDDAGRVACTSDPAILAANSEPWMEAARSVQNFTAGRYTMSPVLKGAFLPFYLRLPTTGSKPGGIMVAALELKWLAQHLTGLKHSGSPFLSNAVLTIADRDGVVLARDVQNETFAGRPFPPAAMPMMTASTPGILRLRSMDGTFRTVGYTPPLPEAHYLATAAGFAEDEVVGDVKRAILQSAALTLAITLLVLALTWQVAHRFIAAPTMKLLDAARRWKEGDLTARVAARDTPLEFGQLAIAFNDMAAMLQRREDDLRRYADAQETQVAKRTQELVETNGRLKAEIEEHRDTSAALLQAQKVQAMGQLAGGLAHDFNNVLQAISGGAALIRKRSGDPATIERIIGMVEDATQRGSSITRRLLAFAHREELRADSLDVQEVLGGLREMLTAALGPTLLIELSITPGLPHVLADRGQLETVLVNLVTNARDAMPAGGVVRLSANAEPAHEDGQFIRLEVADDGEGMDEATLQRATEPFFTTKPLGKGTGLGLTMARSFAEGSGGTFELGSALGVGTQAVLWLPAARTQAAPEAPPIPSRSHDERHLATGRACSILLVDDEPMLREIVGAQLTEDGYHVIEADGGEAALALVATHDHIDLLISDLSMPGMDGIALIRQAQRKRRNLPAILLTGYAGNSEAFAVHDAVDCSFTVLRKPIAAQALADHVAMALRAFSEH